MAKSDIIMMSEAWLARGSEWEAREAYGTAVARGGVYDDERWQGFDGFVHQISMKLSKWHMRPNKDICE